MNSIRLPAVLDSLHEVQEFVVQCAEKMGAPDDLALKLELVMEELAVNVFSYAYGDGTGDVEVVCSESDVEGRRALRVDIKDWGVPFNPLGRDEPDTEASMDERGIGGWGIHLAVVMTDAIAYAREDEANVLSVLFKLEP